MGLPDGVRPILAGAVFLVISLSLLYGLATWLMGTPWDTRAERLEPIAFVLLALLLPKVYTWLIRPPESASVRHGNHSGVRYLLVLGYAALATIVAWVVTFTSRWFFPVLRKTGIGFVIFVASIVILLIHHFAIWRTGSRSA